MSRWKDRLITLVMALAFACTAAGDAEIHVFAAASLTESLKEIGAAYERRTGDKVVFNFGASSFLARQIEEGAPADIFFSADEAKMDQLEARGLIEKGTRRSRLSNRLVVIVAGDDGARIQKPADLARKEVRRIALAEPRTVPAGIYAKAYLQARKLWSAVEDKVIPTANVRATLSAVESGNVDAGIVYKTDAAISRRVRIACEVPKDEGPAISYPVALTSESGNGEAARRFLEHLCSEEAGRVFRTFGFIVQ